MRKIKKRFFCTFDISANPPGRPKPLGARTLLGCSGARNLLLGRVHFMDRLGPWSIRWTARHRLDRFVRGKGMTARGMLGETKAEMATRPNCGGHIDQLLLRSSQLIFELCDALLLRHSCWRRLPPRGNRRYRANDVKREPVVATPRTIPSVAARHDEASTSLILRKVSSLNTHCAAWLRSIHPQEQIEQRGNRGATRENPRGNPRKSQGKFSENHRTIPGELVKHRQSCILVARHRFENPPKFPRDPMGGGP